MLVKEVKRVARHRRVRKKVIGSPDRLRLCIRRSLTNFYAQVIDDSQNKVLLGMSTLNKEVKKSVKYGGNKNAAESLGTAFAKVIQDKGIKKVCFDRGGYKYHGRVQAFAEAVRKAGLEF